MVNNSGAIRSNSCSAAVEFARCVGEFARYVDGAGELGDSPGELGGMVGGKLTGRANWVTARANSPEKEVADGVRGATWHRGRALSRGKSWAVTLNDGFMFK